MTQRRELRAAGTLLAACVAALSGCMTSSESAGQQQLTANVGRYDSPPAGLEKPRVGVPEFKSSGQGSGKELNDIAGDQLTTLAVNTERFDVIERAQLDQLLKEQGLEGVVKAEELAQSGKIRGVDYLLIGKVSNLRVKAEKANRGFGLGNIRLPGGGSLGAFDFKRKDSVITAECGVDIRLIDATSGSIAAAQSSDYTRTDSIGAFGVEILGANAEADADLKLDNDNKGLILRLALDDAMRKMLPKVDKKLLDRSRELKAKAAAAAPAAPPAAQPAAGAGAPAELKPAEAAPAAVAKKFCPGCGKPVAANIKFCTECGAKVE